MINFVCGSLAEIYEELYRNKHFYKDSNPRGKRTKEIIAPTLYLHNPRNRIAYNPIRRFGFKYAFVESLMLFDNAKDLKYFLHYNKNMAKFSDDGYTLYGSYGYRIADYIKLVIDKLKNDNDTRQAVLPILRVEDSFVKTKDIPCTLSLQFLIRDNRLNMITNMRSNDIILGLPYDIFIFTTLQEIIANELEIDLGWYIHRPASLHLYEEHFDLFEDIGENFVNVQITNNCKYDEWVKIKDAYKNSIEDAKWDNSKEIVYKTYEDLILHNIKKVKEDYFGG